MLKFEEETLIRQLIASICRPIVDKVEAFQRDTVNFKLSLNQHDRQLDILMNQLDLLQTEIKTIKNQLDHNQQLVNENNERLLDVERNSNTENQKLKLEQGVIKLEQENNLKQMTVLGELHSSLTERVEMYNNYLSQKTYQLEFQVANVDTTTTKEVKTTKQQNNYNQEEIEKLNQKFSEILLKVQSSEQEIAKFNCSKQWMSDLLVDLRQRIEHQQQSDSNIPNIEQIEKQKIINQVNKDYVDEQIQNQGFFYDKKLQKIDDIIQKLFENQEKQEKSIQTIQIQILKLLEDNVQFQNNLEIIKKDQLSNFQSLEDIRILNNQNNQQTKDAFKKIKQQMNKIQQSISTIEINITGLDLRMAETHQRVIHVYEKQKEIKEVQEQQASFQFYTNNNEIITHIPDFQYNSDSCTNQIIQCKQLINDKQIQIQKEQEQQYNDTKKLNLTMNTDSDPYQTLNYKDNNFEENELQIRMKNDIIKLKSDVYNDQQYNQTQIAQLQKDRTLTNYTIQEIEKELKQFNQYFSVIFSIILHNELIGTDNQVKIIGNGFKFEFFPFQQDERYILTYQNSKTNKIELLMKTIQSNQSLIRKQKQNTFEFQLEKKRFQTETSREIQTMSTFKKANRIIEDKTRTERLNLSLDNQIQLPKQKVKKVLMKYKRIFD